MTAPDTGMNFGELFNKHGGEAEILPEGNYDVVVDEASTKSSKDGSKPQVVIKFKIVDHPKFSNRKITNTFTITTSSEMAMSIFFRQMAALGFGGEFWAQNPTNPLPTLAAQVVGRRARIAVKHDSSYQNTTRAKVNNVMPGGGGPAGLGGGLPPAPGVGGGFAPPPPPVPAASVPSVQQLMQPPAPAAPAPAPAVQEQAPAPAPAAPAVEQAPPAPEPAAQAPEQAPEQAPVPAGAVPPAPAVPF